MESIITARFSKCLEHLRFANLRMTSIYSHSSIEAWVTAVKGVAIQNLGNGWVEFRGTYHSKQLLRRSNPGIRLACGQLELQHKNPNRK